MKKFIILLCLVIFGTSFLGSQDVFQTIVNKSRWELADAYWQVAGKFEALGQKTRAQEFKEEAKAIYPAYPQQPQTAAAVDKSPDSTLGTQGSQTLDPLTGISERPRVKERNMDGQKIVRYQFTKMIRGFLSGDLNLILSAVSNSLVINGAPALSYQDIIVPAKDFFNQTATSELSPNSLFHLETLGVSPVSGTVDNWVVQIDAFTGQLEGLSFWKLHQSYFFERVGDIWKLYKIESKD